MPAQCISNHSSLNFRKASASVPVPWFGYVEDGIEAIDAAEGVVGDDVRFSSGERCSGVMTVPSSARATVR